VLVFVCVGAFCACRYDTMMQIEAEMMSGEQWTEEMFLAMHKYNIPQSRRLANVSPNELPLKTHDIPLIYFTGVFSTANLDIENDKASVQKNPKHLNIFTDSDLKLTELCVRKGSIHDSVHSEPSGASIDEAENLERIIGYLSSKEKTPEFRLTRSPLVVF